MIVAAFLAGSDLLLAQTCVPTGDVFNQSLDCLTSCTLGSSYIPGSCPLCKVNAYVVRFPDNYTESVNLSATGAYNEYFNGCSAGLNYAYNPAIVQCWPTFLSPVTSSGYFSTYAYDDSVTTSRGSCGLAPYNIYAACASPGAAHRATVSHICSSGSPIILDIFEEGFHLTSPGNGVEFRMLPGGPLSQMSWTDGVGEMVGWRWIETGTARLTILRSSSAT